MRLWHETLISDLPRQQLLGQHRECCALRGKGWNRPHTTVQYVFDYSPYKLYQYHQLIMEEMKSRTYQPDERWEDQLYGGKPVTLIANSNQSHLRLPFIRNIMQLIWRNV